MSETVLAPARALPYPHVHLPVPAAVARAMIDPSVDLLPWAAYTIGREAFALRLWQQVFWDLGWGPFSAKNGVPATVVLLRCAGQILAGGMPAGADRELDRLLGSLLRLHENLTRQRPETVGDGEAPGFDLWCELAGLASHALPSSHPNRPWLDLGLALGRAEVDASREDASVAQMAAGLLEGREVGVRGGRVAAAPRTIGPRTGGTRPCGPRR